MLKLYTVVHPMAADNPWNSIAGWRWAIHLDTRFDQWAEGCLNAMQYETQAEAETVLSMVLITVRRALKAAGIDSEVVASVRTDCPLNSALVDELAVLL